MPVLNPTYANRPLRVLFVQSTTEMGGAESALLTLLQSLDRAEIEPFVASLEFGEGSLPEKIESLRIPVFRLPRGRFRNVASTAAKVRALRGLIRKNEIDVVVSNGGHANLFARPAAKLARRPCAWWVHMYDESTRIEGRKAIARAERMLAADVLYANSQFTAAKLALDFPDGPPIRVVRPGVDLQKFHPDPAAGARVREEEGIPSGHPVIGIFGRLQRGKGQHIFLRAAGLLAGRGVRFTAVVVGGSLFGLEPEYAEELRNMANEPLLAGRVRFLGNRENPEAWMNACDVVVQASVEPETWGLVVAEAMACGRPVLASSAGGPLEMIDHKRTGWLTPPGDDVALAAWLVILLTNPALRAELGEAARRHAEAEFDPRRAAGLLSTELWRLWAARLDRVELLPEVGA
jgi:glycosyltransferase involved in cell wall biosynthesis